MYCFVIQSLCEPCAIKYDFVAKLETLDADLDTILPHYHAEKIKNNFPTVNTNALGIKTYKDMYVNISMSVLQPVLHKYQADADMFGYTFDDYYK